MADRRIVEENNQAPITIKARGINKKFKLYYDKGTSIKERFISRKRSRYEERWVLRGVDLTAREGEAIGLIGENGCGKSTMLKMLSRIMYPDRGSVEIVGRVSSLIELGAGFHPDLSGRENIYTNAAIFGLNREEIEARMEDIVAFCELGEYLDNPVRTYSSGMYMRLAFSIAINVDANVLLIDEILAVGDANFQAKCFQKLREIKANGTTIIIVSHDLDTIQSFCDQALWICDGKVASQGTSKRVVEDYRQYMNEKYIESVQAQQVHESEPADSTKSEAEDAMPEVADGASVQEHDMPEENGSHSVNRFGLRYVEITKIDFLNKKGDVTSVFIEGEPADIDIYYHIEKPLPAYQFGVGFFSMGDVSIYGINTQLDGLKVILTETDGKVRFHIDKIPLLGGRYYFSVAVQDENGVAMDYYRRYREFDVISAKTAIGICDIPHDWILPVK